MSEALVYRHGDVELHGLVERPERWNGAVVLVAHEINGIGVNVRQRAKQLAGRGYIAFIADHYGEGGYYEGNAAREQMLALQGNTELFRGRVRAGLDAVKKLAGVGPDKCAAIGYCFGGQAVLELARSGSPVAAVVSFHGVFGTGRSAQIGEVKAKVLACTGYLDPLVPPEDIAAFQAEMHAAEADWQLIAYGRAYHAFTNPNVEGNNGTLAYDASADRQSWAAAMLFIEEALGLPAQGKGG